MHQRESCKQNLKEKYEIHKNTLSWIKMKINHMKNCGTQNKTESEIYSAKSLH